MIDFPFNNNYWIYSCY